MSDLKILLANYIFTLVSVFFQTQIIQMICDLKFKRGYMASFILLTSILSGNALYYANHPGVNNISIIIFFMAFLISCMILVKLILGPEFTQSFVAAVILALILASSFAVSYFMQAVFGEDGKCLKENLWRYVFVHIFINIVNMVIYITIKSYKLISGHLDEIKKKVYIINPVYIIFILLLALFNMWYFYGSSSHELMGLLFVFNTLLLLLLFIKWVLSATTLLDYANKSRELEYQIFCNKTLNEMTYDIRAFKHNYDNMLASIKSLVEARQIDELEDFINETVEKKNKAYDINNLMLLNIKNAGILGIIAFKAENAKKMGVDIRITVNDEIKSINIKTSDLCEILGILLDNAIESAAESEKRFIDLNIAKDEDAIIFTMKNSILEKPAIGRIFEKGYSTKGENRGLGLWIVNRIICNYHNVLLNTFVDEKVFRQELIIN